MKKVIRLTESDLVRLVKRVISEQTQKIQDTDGIPCVKQNFRFPTYKVTDQNLLSKLQGKINPNPVLSQKNILVYDNTNVSLPGKKFGTVTFYSDGNKLGAITLDGTLGDELYSISTKNLVGQGGNKIKIGWVFCNGNLYLYDIIGEKI